LQDAFDALLTDSATVLYTDGTTDARGISPNLAVVSLAPVACRVSLGMGRAKEWFADKKGARNFREVFMRPFSDKNGKQLSIHHWMRITSQRDGANQLYEIIQVDPPSALGPSVHHLQVWCQIFIP
jgi:hypothetical protein